MKNKKLKELLKTQKKDKAQEYLNGWKRTQADFENYKKRQVQVQEEFRNFANEDLIMQLLPILDNFQASTEHIPEEQKDSPWVAGIMHIQKQLEEVLFSNGLEEIVVKVGDEFDAEVCEAVDHLASPQNTKTQKHENTKIQDKENKIKKVVKRGYKLKGKVVRAVKVIVE